MNAPVVKRNPHIKTRGYGQSNRVLYKNVSSPELKKRIKEMAADRKTNSSGYDLQEMRQEWRRRQNGIVKKDNETYNKKVMLERPEKSEPFKKPRFITGMSPKQEKFCMEYMATGDALVAYKAAGYAEGSNVAQTNKRANALLKSERIEKRLEELRKEAIHHMAWSSDKVLNSFKEVYDDALNNGDYTNCNRSLESIAKHLGMFIDRMESKIKYGHLESGDTQEDVNRDIERLAEIAGFKVVQGGKKN